MMSLRKLEGSLPSPWEMLLPFSMVAVEVVSVRFEWWERLGRLVVDDNGAQACGVGCLV